MSSKPSLHSLMLALSASLPLLLTGCAASTEIVAPVLPDAPAGLQSCAADPIPPIPGVAGTSLSKAQAAEALAEQRASVLSKIRCARGWKKFYDDLTKAMKGETGGVE